MSEERKLILEMVAQGKVTPEEAELLLQAIEEGERSARSAAAEEVHQRRGGTDLGEVIERAVGSSLRHLEQNLRELEEDLQGRLRDQNLHGRIEERIRAGAERAAARAAEAERRAARHAERAQERAERIAERTTERARELEREFTRHGAHFIKVGVHIDKETVIKHERLDLAAQPGDRLVLENRVGDITVSFTDAASLAVDVTKTVWGADRQDAEERAEATQIRLERNGSNVVVAVRRPTIAGVGFLNLKDTRLDYHVRAPRGTNLELTTRVGDIRVEAAATVGDWSLVTKVGEIDVAVGAGAGFRYQLETRTGQAVVALPEQNSTGHALVGTMGDQSGRISAVAKTGTIRLHS